MVVLAATVHHHAPAFGAGFGGGECDRSGRGRGAARTARRSAAARHSSFHNSPDGTAVPSNPAPGAKFNQDAPSTRVLSSSWPGGRSMSTNQVSRTISRVLPSDWRSPRQVTSFNVKTPLGPPRARSNTCDTHRACGSVFMPPRGRKTMRRTFEPSKDSHRRGRSAYGTRHASWRSRLNSRTMPLHSKHLRKSPTPLSPFRSSIA